jgi:hypothetical protein
MPTTTLAMTTDLTRCTMPDITNTVPNIREVMKEDSN